LLHLVGINLFAWCCRVLPKSVQTSNYYFSRTIADLFMTVYVKRLQVPPELFIAVRCVKHTARASCGHLENQTSSERYRRSFGLPSSLQRQETTLEASVYELQIYSRYSFQLYLKTQSVPRSKHTPSQL